MFFRKTWLSAVGAALTLGGMVSAQEGVVRISDRPHGLEAQPAGWHHSTPGQYHEVPTEHGYGYADDCPGCRGRHRGGPFQEHYCKNSPDHGYSVPAKWPLHRRGVQYNSLFPNQWYGTPGGGYGGESYPMVYQPTDTTQLGFYYQHVPSWQPNPNMLPARPVPAQWHITAPKVYASSFGQSAAGSHVFGAHHRHGYGNCPNCYYDMGPSDGVAPTPIPENQPPAEIPPSPSTLEARSASY